MTEYHKKAIPKSDALDCLSILGVFYPGSPTDAMRRFFGSDILNDIVKIHQPDRFDVDTVRLTKAIKLACSGNRTTAKEYLQLRDVGGLQSLLSMTQNFLENLLSDPPRVMSETLLKSAHVAPLLNGYLGVENELDKSSLNTYHLDRVSSTQRDLGWYPLRPDFVVNIDNREVAFVEVASFEESNCPLKVGGDLYKLARFGRAVLATGIDSVQLVQVVHGMGVYHKMYLRAGIMYLRKIGAFVIPISLSHLSCMGTDGWVLMTLRKTLLALLKEGLGNGKKIDGMVDIDLHLEALCPKKKKIAEVSDVVSDNEVE